MSAIGARLKEERAAFGMTQERFGSIGGVATRAQQNYESGARSPDAQYFAKIEKIGVDIHYIITGHRHSAVVEVFEPVGSPMDFALVKNILELFREEPRCQTLDTETIARVFIVLYRNNLNWKTKIGSDMLSAVIDAMIAVK